MEPLESSVTVSRIRHLFDYDPNSGAFTRRVGFGRAEAGTVICSKSLVVDGEEHKLSRYIWLHFYGEWPPIDMLVDHEDRNDFNNRIANLRLATYSENQYNKESPHNPHGYKGVTWRDRKTKPWLARIRVQGMRINLGDFATKEEAAEAYKKAVIEYHGNFANTEGTIEHAQPSEPPVE